MANTFKSTLTSNLPTTLTSIYSAPTSTGGIATLIGVAFSNKGPAPVTIDVGITRTIGGVATTVYILKTGVVVPGGTLTVAGADQKVILIQNDLLVALSSIASSVDVIVSALEITP